MSTLYLVATPIGNLEDITLRALRVLQEVELIAAEDTRTTAKLLRRYEIRTPMLSFFEHNELVRQSIYQLEVGKLLPMVTELRWIWDAMRPSYQGIFTGQVSPAQAAQAMQLTAEKLIKENRE